MTSAISQTTSSPARFSKQELRLEAQKRLVRRDCLAWCRTLGFEPAPHHRLFIRELVALMDATDYDTLLIFAPPGSAKSHHVSVAFPPWYLAQRPGNMVIAASHNVQLARKWGRRVRNLIAANTALLGVALAADDQAADHWSLTTGGEYLAAGAGMGISGQRADLGIIDDPFGKREDAYSEVTREKIWNWYLSDIGPRLKPDAKRVVMHTRWHQDDLAGRIIDQATFTGQKLRIVSIPAIAEAGDILGRQPGEYLWDEPAGYNYGKTLRDRQRELPPMEWAALYQQQPVPEGGGYFKADWVKYYDVLPASLRPYGASDYAVTADGGDFTEHGVGGIDTEGNLYLIDWWYGQTASDVWVEHFLDMMGRHATLAWAEEQGQIIKSLGPFIDRRMQERGVHGFRQQFTSTNDKAVRARAIQARMSMGKVLFPRHAPWVQHVVPQLLAFPAGKHDDAVDVLSLFGRLLDQMNPAQAPKAARPRPHHGAGGWMG